MSDQRLESNIMSTDCLTPYQSEEIELGPVELFYNRPITVKMERFASTGGTNLGSLASSATIRLRCTNNERLYVAKLISSNMVLTEPISIFMDGYIYEDPVTPGQTRIETMVMRSRLESNVVVGPVNVIYIESTSCVPQRLFRRNLITFTPSAEGFTYGDSMNIVIRRYSRTEYPAYTFDSTMYIVNIFMNVTINSPFGHYP